ncbi:hypothetical protein LJC04_04475, partial [Ruminococcaceae bacterium OttesenSCG-928-O06]|nr:hypothetical protein [Ruminococcaceae bacterium OttesenSCG-928-O06]
MKKNGIFTFIFALVPGCGQMYQGYMKRGLSLMFWFCAVIAVSVLTHVYVLMVLLPVVWAYSFFDSFNLRSLSEQQRAVFADSFIPDAKWLNDTGMEKWVKGIRFGKVAGWVCVGIGVLILYGNLWDVLYSTLWHYTPVLAYWMDRLPGIAIAVVVI